MIEDRWEVRGESKGAGQDAGRIGTFKWQSLDMTHARLGHHLSNLAFGVGSAPVGIYQHIQGKNGREERTIGSVIQDEIVDQHQSPLLQSGNRLFYDHPALIRPLTVKDVG